METYEVDYENSKTIEWTFKEKNGQKKVVWKAIEDDKTDENGSLVARIQSLIFQTRRLESLPISFEATIVSFEAMIRSKMV